MPSGGSCSGGSDISFDLLVKNGRVYAEGLRSQDIWIKDGKIAALGGSHRADEEIDAHGMLVLPGAIDAHVHFRDPGPNYKEDWFTGSLSAAAGGVTTVIDQPNTEPRTMDTGSFQLKLDLAGHRSVVDFGINGGPGRIGELVGLGASAIGEIFTYEHGDLELWRIFEEVERLGALPTIHAEDGLLIKEHLGPCKDRRDPEVYSLARPSAVEAAAVEKVLGSAKKAHICHLSSRQGLDLVRAAKRRGQEISCEVSPHHVLLNRSDWRKQGSFLKTNPPLRDLEDNHALWEGLREGTIDMIASDHAPHLPEEKNEEIWEAPPGVPGVETMLPLMLVAARSNLVILERLVDALSTKPARVFGLRAKGRIALGMDADLVLVDPRSRTRIRAERLHSRADWTPYEGREGIFPKLTMVRGKVVFDGDLEVRPGYGRFQGRR